MNKKLIIFGTGKIAEVVGYYAMQECDFEVAAFTVDREYMVGSEFCGRPVVPFDELMDHYPPSEYNGFVAVGYHNLNGLRAGMVSRLKEKGYGLVSVIPKTGALPGNVSIGENCFIMPPAIIHPFVSIGNNVFVWSGAMVGHHSLIGDNCWLTSTCNIGGNCRIGKNTFIAMDATIGHSVTIGQDCFIGSGTLTIKNLDDEKVVISEASKPIKVSTKQFLRFANFSDL